ncbi:hypothetical protein Leryth_005200 [Lithospermum erythrorhizon]|nr:hypothetical protein Leryth_005200 [Lithospermum erythrorhizon]
MTSTIGPSLVEAANNYVVLIAKAQNHKNHGGISPKKQLTPKIKSQNMELRAPKQEQPTLELNMDVLTVIMHANMATVILLNVHVEMKNSYPFEV